MYSIIRYYCPKGYCVREIQTGSRIKMCESCLCPSVIFCWKGVILSFWDTDTRGKIAKPCSRYPKLKINYTCRARWPEELLCWLSQFLKSNIVQILKTHIVQIWKSEHLEHGFAILHLVSVSQNVKITLFSQNATPDRQTDGHGHDSHIFILDPVCISRTQ